jgi:hypothetical protein
LFELTHPVHLHLFRVVIRELEARGHQTAITAREKDVLLDLLRGYGFEFECLSRRGRGLLGLARELIVRDWRLWRFARRFRPDVLVGSVGTCAAHVGWLMGRPVLVVDNMEHAALQQWLSFPFVTQLCTAQYYGKDWGKRQVRYPSFEHLAYLHPNHFTPDPAVVERAGLRRDEPFLMVRFVSWEATHDAGEHGIRSEERMHVLERLERFGRVIVTSERPLPDEYDRFRLPVPAHEYHHLLAFARCYLGDAATVAAEAAVLGVPSILVCSWEGGYHEELQNKYGLLQRVESEAEALAIAGELLTDAETPRRWRQRRKRLLDEQEDLAEWLVREIEGFCPLAAVATESQREAAP